MGVHFNRMVIIGVGLIGGSLALTSRRKGLADCVVGVGRNRENLKRAIEIGAIDEFYTEPEKAVIGADIIILCSPVGSFIEIINVIKDKIGKGCILTDVGSVKGELVGMIEEVIPKGIYYIGGHPIAGGERSGIEAVSAFMFNGALCILTPTSKTDMNALKTVKELWEVIGCRVTCMEPWLHDRIFAAVSHLPHIIAFALVNTVARLNSGRYLEYSGSGFRDTTRIASSSPEIWKDICMLNRDNTIEMMELFEKELGVIKRNLQEKRWDLLIDEFMAAKKVRDEL